MPSRFEAERAAAVAFRLTECSCGRRAWQLDGEGGRVCASTCAKHVAKRAVLTNAEHPHRIENLIVDGSDPVGLVPYTNPQQARDQYDAFLRGPFTQRTLSNIVRLYCRGELVAEWRRPVARILEPLIVVS